MVWAKVDDRLHSSAKWRAASKGARALWATALSWCADQETDGSVPSHMLTALDGTRMEARTLVDVGLWETTDEGWIFRNWSEYQPTRDQLDEKRRVERERIAAARANAKARRDVVGANTSPTHDGVGDRLNNPDPTRPDPTPSLSDEREQELLSPDESDDRGSLLQEDWRPNQGHIDKAKSLHLDVGAEYRRFREHAERTQRRQTSWNAAFTNWLRKGAEMAQQRQGRTPQQHTTPDDKFADTIERGRRLAGLHGQGEIAS